MCSSHMHVKPQGLLLLWDVTCGLERLCRGAVTDTLHLKAAKLLCVLPVGYIFIFQRSFN